MHFPILVAIASQLVQALPTWFCMSCVADEEKTILSSERAGLQRINSAAFRVEGQSPLTVTEKIVDAVDADKQRRLSSEVARAMSAPLPKISAPGKVGAAASTDSAPAASLIEGTSNSKKRMFKKVIVLPPPEVGSDGKLFFPPARHFEN